MKHLIKTLFFGYLPLGWKRLLRVATFGVWFWIIFSQFLYSGLDRELLILAPLALIGVIATASILSYVISGFIKQKKTLK